MELTNKSVVKDSRSIDQSGIPFIISLAGLHGGTGKTTLTFELGKAFATQGERVLLVDLDPKADLTNMMGITPNADFYSMGSVLLRETTIHNVLGKKADLNIALSSRETAQAEAKLYQPADGIARLDKVLREVYLIFDVILIDCPSSLGRLTQNALLASDMVITPVLEGFNMLHAVEILNEEIESIRTHFNSDLIPLKLVKVYHENQANSIPPTFNKLIEKYPDQIFETTIQELLRIRRSYHSGQLDMNMVSTEPIIQLYNELDHFKRA